MMRVESLKIALILIVFQNFKMFLTIWAQSLSKFLGGKAPLKSNPKILPMLAHLTMETVAEITFPIVSASASVTFQQVNSNGFALALKKIRMPAQKWTIIMIKIEKVLLSLLKWRDHDRGKTVSFLKQRHL